VKVDLVAGLTPVSLGSIDQTTHELTELIRKCRGADADRDPGVHVAAREVAELAHSATAGIVAVVEHAAADPALLFGVVVATPAPVRAGDAAQLRAHLADDGGADLCEVVESRSPKGYPVVFAERIVTAVQLRAGEAFDCQLQAVVADPVRPRIAVFTLSSTTGRGWLELSAVFGRLVASVDFSTN
jgi:hypothetical protein